MNNLFVYCEVENGKVADVSLELLTKGRSLAQQLGCQLEAVLVGYQLDSLAQSLFEYGADVVHVADDKRLYPYLTLPHTAIVNALIKQEQPQIALMGATTIGRDLGPRVSSALHSGLTADCTSLEIGDHADTKGNEYKNLLYQIRPAFGGNIIATIVNPECRPQMATVREGVMKKEALPAPKKGIIKKADVAKILNDTDFVVKIIDRQIEERKIDIKNAGIIVSGGYGMGSKENFALLHELAAVLGGEVGASRAAVDAGLAEHERQVGQTGVTVRPKLYIACGISGQIQHTAGMDQSAMVIAINNDPNAPINQLADYAITGDVCEVVNKLIKYYKKNSK
ncbi:electron transfer flavoprotein subunit alpha [Bacteroidia bacterium]|nr:electron transfer flavoprotein subunit alpha [Bacteroidia bacterium]